MSETVKAISPDGKVLTVTRTQFDGVYRHLGYTEETPKSRPRKSTSKRVSKAKDAQVINHDQA